MLSFDLSAIDIVLLVAVLILFSLYVSRKPGAAAKTEALESRYASNAERKPETSMSQKDNSSAQEFGAPVSKRLDIGSQSCPHVFGYLKDLPRNTPVPDECFGCPQVMKCLFPYEQ